MPLRGGWSYWSMLTMYTWTEVQNFQIVKDASFFRKCGGILNSAKYMALLNIRWKETQIYFRSDNFL